MDTTAMFEMMDVIVLVFGFYALYAAWVLKTEGKIIKTFLVFKDTDVDSCKDLAAYAGRMSPKLGALGTAMVVYGAVAVLNVHVVPVPTLYRVMLAVFILVLVWYAVEVKRAMKEYF